MANISHVEIVKQGSEAISRWRALNPHVHLDLTGITLPHFNLEGLDLTKADMMDA